MKQMLCPLDGKPCERDCPDRYHDQPEGGCFLTTALEIGGQIMNLGGGDVAVMFRPDNRKRVVQ